MRTRTFYFLSSLVVSVSSNAVAGICVGGLEDCQLVVNFEKNSAALSDEARNRVLAFSKVLKQSQLPIGTIMVEGFTDASGSDRYNISLSERRAHSVLMILAEQGFDVSKFIARGYGKMRPIMSDPYDPANRRVELHWKSD